MRILAVVPLYPPHHIGGYEVVCKGVMDRLAERGHEVMVLTSATQMPGVDGGGDDGSVRVKRTLDGWWDWDTNGPRHTTPVQRLRVERHSERALRAALNEFRPDVASIWSLVYMSFSLATLLEQRSIPLVVTMGDDWICFAAELDAWMRTLSRRPWLAPPARVLGFATALPTFRGAQVSFASRMIADRVGSSARWRFEDATVIPMGIETRDFPVVDLEETKVDWHWRLLYMGRVVPQKGVHTAVRALAQLPSEATLDVDGYCSAGDRAELSALADEVGVSGRIRFSFSARPELAARYRHADAVLFPSEWPEPFGLVPLEAMACGTPVVATGTGGSGEFLLDGDNCLLFPPGDAGALADAVRRLASAPDLRRRIVTGGIQTAHAMTLDVYAERLEALHLAAAGRSVTARPGVPGGRG